MMELSAGHIALSADGKFEFYELDGQVYRAPTYAPISDCIRNVRGGRWECSREHLDRYWSVILPGVAQANSDGEAG